MITEKEVREIEIAVTAFTMLTKDLRKAGRDDKVEDLKKVLLAWVEPRSDEFKILFAETLYSMADIVRVMGGE